MKNNVVLIEVAIMGILIISACAQQLAPQVQPEPSIASGQTSTTPSPLTVTTSVPVESEPLTEITPSPGTSTPGKSSTDGQKTITLADRGKTIILALGESFLLKLGEGYTWEISLSDQSVISRVKNITVINGAQGVYEALKPGTVALTATGDPLCRQSKPACGMPSILFEITIIVK